MERGLTEMQGGDLPCSRSKARYRNRTRDATAIIRRVIDEGEGGEGGGNTDNLARLLHGGCFFVVLDNPQWSITCFLSPPPRPAGVFIQCVHPVP